SAGNPCRPRAEVAFEATLLRRLLKAPRSVGGERIAGPAREQHGSRTIAQPSTSERSFVRLRSGARSGVAILVCRSLGLWQKRCLRGDSMQWRKVVANVGAGLCAGSLMAVVVWANWPQWRGPNLNGSTQTAHDLPVTWSESQNVLWRTKLPSWSAATPIVWRDTIFVTSAEEGFVPLRGGTKPGQGTPDKIFLIA